jgi:hypothetical protein
MIGKKIDFMQTAKVSGVITASALTLSWLFATLLNQIVQPLFSAIPAVSPITGTVGEKILALIGGVIPIQDIFGFGVLAMFISSFVIVLLGEWLIDSFKLPVFQGMLGMNQRMGRLASVIIYGSIPIYAILIGMTLPTMSVALGVIVYTVLLSVLAVTVAGFAKLKI